jgi:hypothetical protein
MSLSNTSPIQRHRKLTKPFAQTKPSCLIAQLQPCRKQPDMQRALAPEVMSRGLA